MPIQFEVNFNAGIISVDLDEVEDDLPLVGWKLRVEGCYDIPLPDLGRNPPPPHQ